MTVGGLPLHPLIVHAVVVLLPLAALGTVLIAARPSWRRPYGPPVLALAIVGAVSVPIATASGTDLAMRLGNDSPLLETHMSRASLVLPTAIVFVVLLAAAVVLERWPLRSSGSHSDATAARIDPRIVLAATVLAAVAGIVLAVFVVRTGDAGATMVWTT